MYGAMIGDIVGSQYEFTFLSPEKGFAFFPEYRNCFTDDTVMTLAVGEALMDLDREASVKEIHRAVTDAMQRWGRRYPRVGYGKYFRNWLFDENPQPYGSYGNGSAMRVSAAGWLYDTLERTREVARATAEVTHNHPDGIQGAEATATAIFMARSGYTKGTILLYMEEQFGYRLSAPYEIMRKWKRKSVACRDTLPKALKAFAKGRDYEEVIRYAVLFGGDTDTIAAIAGSIAEAYYGIPKQLITRAKEYITVEMMELLERFDRTIGRNVCANREIVGEVDTYAQNKVLRSAIDHFYALAETEQYADAYTAVLEALAGLAVSGEEVPVPMVDQNHAIDTVDWKKLRIGSSFSFDKELRMTIDKVRDGQGKHWIPLYTDEDEVHKQPTTNLMINLRIMELIHAVVREENVQGLVINPFGQHLLIPRDYVAKISELQVE